MDTHDVLAIVNTAAPLITPSGEAATVVTTTPVVMQETKPFYKTSEFWTVVFTNLLAMGAQLVDILPPKYGIPLQGVINMGYVLSRGIAKSGNPVMEVEKVKPHA